MHEVVAAVARRSDDVKTRASGSPRCGRGVVSVAEFEQNSAAEIDLILDATEILPRIDLRGRRYWVEGAEANAAFVIGVHQKIGEQNVAPSDVDLGVEQIAAGKPVMKDCVYSKSTVSANQARLRRIGPVTPNRGYQLPSRAPCWMSRPGMKSVA